jgi:predicted dehydrogenase
MIIPLSIRYFKKDQRLEFRSRASRIDTFERQFRDFGDAIEKGRKPLVAGEEGYQALEIVDAVYRSCRTGQKVIL